MRFAIPLAIVALAAAMLASCGGSSSSGGPTAAPKTGATSAPVGASAHSCDGAIGAESLRAVSVSCGQARRVLLGWQGDSSCKFPSGASRAACTTDSYRCLSAKTDRGITVACSRPSESVAFIAESR